MNIYISNLGNRVTEESLNATFSAYGTVNATTIVMDALTGRSRGFAYVDMPVAIEATIAIQRINGSIIDGRLIRAEEAIGSKDFMRPYPAAHLFRR